MRKKIGLNTDKSGKVKLAMHHFELSPIFLRIQIQLMRLLVGLLVSQLLPSFYIVWYDLPTNHSDLNDQNLFHSTIDAPPGVPGVSKNLDDQTKVQSGELER